MVLHVVWRITGDSPNLPNFSPTKLSRYTGFDKPLWHTIGLTKTLMIHLEDLLLHFGTTYFSPLVEILYRIVGKFGNFGESSVIRQTKTIQISTYNKLSID